MSESEKQPEDQGAGEVKLRVPCEVYSRIVGYLRPVQAWNQGKQQEFKDRRLFKVSDSQKTDA